MELPENTIQITISIDQDTDVIDVELYENLSLKMPEDQELFYLDVCNGLMGKLQSDFGEFRTFGSMLRKISELEDEIHEESDGTFEPAAELLEAIADFHKAKKNGSKIKESGTVLNFKKKMH